jgi:phosphoserine/homoserine phosphotransferase
MEILCFDMEGTLTPEIWEQVAKNSGIDDFNKTTRDIPNYSDLMDFRLDLMNKNNMNILDIQKAASQLDPLPGAKEFLDRLREKFQIVILSDTFHEIAKPLMKKLGYPFLLCHNLKVIDDEIVSYEFRHPQAKKQAIESFKSLGYRCFAAGDSHNDIQMFEVADKGFFINAPLKISSKHPEIESYDNYNDLEKAIYSNSIFVQT